MNEMAKADNRIINPSPHIWLYLWGSNEKRK